MTRRTTIMTKERHNGQIRRREQHLLSIIPLVLMVVAIKIRTVDCRGSVVVVGGGNGSSDSSSSTTRAAMPPQQQDGCDESKCRTVDMTRTPGYWWLPSIPATEFNGGYTCWVDAVNGDEDSSDTDVERYPCSDDYIGVPVNEEEGEADEDPSTRKWYTCCPLSTLLSLPPLSSPAGGSDADSSTVAEASTSNSTSTNSSTTTTATIDQDSGVQNEIIQRTCSDDHCLTGSCWAVPDGLAPKRCVDDSHDDFMYPRDTGATIYMDHGDVQYNLEQYLCCTSPTAAVTSELDDDLVSMDGFDHDKNTRDRNGDLVPDGCSEAACTSLNGAVGGVGDCWADGITEPFTCNTKDKHNEYLFPTRNGHDDLNMFNFHYVCCNTLQNPIYQDEQSDGLTTALTIQSTISFITFLITSIFTLATLSNIRARNHSWNIYLVMLSIPDAIYNLFRFLYGIIVIKGLNTSIQTTWPIDWFYAVSNLYLNAVIVYQVHYFLRKIQKSVRVTPPSIRLVLGQSLAVYLLAAGCGIWMHYLHTIGNTIAGGSHTRFLEIHKISLCCMVIPPVTFVAILYGDVWYRQLIPTIEGDNRTRVISLYFLRVIFIFMITWLPYMILITYGLRNSRVLGYIGMSISSLQGTLSVAVALTKSDVYWAVRSFITWQCNSGKAAPGATTTYSSGGGGGGGRDGRENSRHTDTAQRANAARRTSASRNSGQIRVSGLFDNNNARQSTEESILSDTNFSPHGSRAFTTSESNISQQFRKMDILNEDSGAGDMVKLTTPSSSKEDNNEEAPVVTKNNDNGKQEDDQEV